MPKQLVFQEVISRAREEQSIDVTMPNGEVFRILPSQLWPEETFDQQDATEQAKYILGDRYDAFIAAGGTARSISLLIQDAAGASIPE